MNLISDLICNSLYKYSIDYSVDGKQNVKFSYAMLFGKKYSSD